MSLDGITLRFAVNELNHELTGGRVQRIYQPQKDTLVMHLSSWGKKPALFLSLNPQVPGCHITAKRYENPGVPPIFCMVLRKHLLGAELLSVRQEDLDRLVHFEFRGQTEMGFETRLTLTAELTGRHSNFILHQKNEEGEDIIVDAANRLGYSPTGGRLILPHKPYELPGRVDKIDILSSHYNIETVFAKYFGSEIPVGRAILDSFFGIGRRFADELAARAGLAAHHVDTLTAPDYERLEQVFSDLRDSLGSPTTEARLLISPEGEPLDFTPFPFLQDTGMPQESYPTLSGAMDAYADTLYRHRNLSQSKKKLNDVVKRLLNRAEKKLQAQKQDLIDLKDTDDLRIRGELLFANLHAIPDPPPPYVELQNYYDPDYKTIRIDIPKGKSAKGQAEALFKKYKKQRGTEAFLDKALPETERLVEYLDSIAWAIQAADSHDSLKQIEKELKDAGYIEDKSSKKQKQKAITLEPRRAECKGFTILVGRNNIGNDELTFSIAHKDDLWFHAREIPGSHVILRTEGKEPDNEVLSAAANLAAVYSRGKNDTLVAVDYTKVLYVKKIKNAMPGMVIYDRFKTALMKPDAAFAASCMEVEDDE